MLIFRRTPPNSTFAREAARSTISTTLAGMARHMSELSRPRPGIGDSRLSQGNSSVIWRHARVNQYLKVIPLQQFACSTEQEDILKYTPGQRHSLQAGFGSN